VDEESQPIRCQQHSHLGLDRYRGHARQLRDYSVIVIDEVHERSSQDELIMGHLGEVSLQGLRRLFMPSDR
jgi:hypothetical protein